MAKTPKPDQPRSVKPEKHGKVLINVYSAMSLITPAVRLLAPHLEYRVTRFEEGGKLGYHEHEEPLALWGFDIHDRMGVPTGLVPRAVRVLAENGYEVASKDHRRFGKRFAVDHQFLKGLGDEDRRLVDLVCENPLGQIEVARFYDLIAAMRLIIYTYPQAHVLIPVATKTLARKIRQKLNEAVMDFDVRLLGRSWPMPTPRCLVCTYHPVSAINTREWDIILLPDPASVISDRGCVGMAHFHGPAEHENHRIYGFFTPEMRLGHIGRLRLEAMSGPVIYRRSPPRTRVRVLWLPSPRCPAIEQTVQALEFKRVAYWHNDRRNDYVAAVARAFAGMDIPKLRKYGVPFVGDEPALGHASEPVVMVLVASTEQGRELLSRLPGWKLFDAVPEHGGLDTDLAGDEPRTRWIVTETRASQNMIDADVIIRAGGSLGTRCLQGLAQQDDRDAEDTILIDFADEFSPWAAEDAWRRHREYDLLGFEAREPTGNTTLAGPADNLH